MTALTIPHFTLEELTRSDEARRLRIANTPDKDDLERLGVLAAGLVMARLIRRAPIIVHSGFRCEALNKAVGGTPTSAHRLGYAADISSPGITAFGLAELLVGRLPYDQLILESSRKVVHISFDPRARGQAMTQRAGPGTPFEQGIML